MSHKTGAEDPIPPSSTDHDAAIQLGHLAAIVESSNDAIVSKSLDGTIRSWNRAAQRIFGHTAEEAVGQPISLIIPPELQAEQNEILATIRNGGHIEHFDTIRLTKDGQRIPISVTISPVRDSRGTIVGASKIARDISERKRAEAALKKTEAGLWAADHRKDDFLAVVAHELRNPLAPIRYALASMKKPDKTAEQQTQAQEIIERQAAHMSRLLDNLLDASRITNGKLELQKSATELTTVLGIAIEAARPILDAKQHALSLDLPKQAVRLVVDPVRLAQVFSNLLINAAKYTDARGSIQILAGETADLVTVSIKDNGIGIAQERIPTIFTMFAQERAAASRSEGGLGIGLSLVQGIVSLHGGTIEARSGGIGQGCDFIVQLPRGAPAAPEDHMAADANAPIADIGLKVLVVDDNRDAADACSTLLELSGHHVQTAYTARQALDLAAISRPHVILGDIGLPDMDGYELAGRIKSAPWGRNIVLVAITGWGHDDDKRKAIEAGFSHHLTKPIEPEMLEALLESVGSQLFSGR